MDGNALFGTVLILAALGFIVSICLWSRRRIDRIQENGSGPFRKILKDLQDGR